MKSIRMISIILLVILIVASSCVTSLFDKEYSSNKGSIDGTGFVIQELDGAGGVEFDVDDNGNIYFPVTSPTKNGIVIYNNKGEYKYTLPIKTIGGLGVKIDEENSILVYDVRANTIKYYNQSGIKINETQEDDYSFGDSLPRLGSENVRERNGIRYVNINGTITKEENGIETIVFTIPLWQRWNRAFSTILILSIVAFFLLIAIPLWAKALKERYAKKGE